MALSPHGNYFVSHVHFICHGAGKTTAVIVKSTCFCHRPSLIQCLIYLSSVILCVFMCNTDDVIMKSGGGAQTAPGGPTDH